MLSLADRVNALIRLAGSSNMNEARNAAYEACKLLRKHNIFLKGRHSPVTKPQPPKPKGPHVQKTKRVNFRTCTNDKQAEQVVKDHIAAGYRLNEEESSRITNLNDIQTLVLDRDETSLHVTIAR